VKDGGRVAALRSSCLRELGVSAPSQTGGIAIDGEGWIACKPQEGWIACKPHDVVVEVDLRKVMELAIGRVQGSRVLASLVRWRCTRDSSSIHGVPSDTIRSAARTESALASSHSRVASQPGFSAGLCLHLHRNGRFTRPGSRSISSRYISQLAT
jgi:hypothetical protein